MENCAMRTIFAFWAQNTFARRGGLQDEIGTQDLSNRNQDR